MNPFAHVPDFFPVTMQLYVLLMMALVVAGTIIDLKHKKSADFFFANSKKQQANAERQLNQAQKTPILIKTVTTDILLSAEFHNPQRRLAHLLKMYGFILFLLTTLIMVFTGAGGLWGLLWHIGALMVCVGGYWFWFKLRVDVSAEGHQWYEVVPADLFILSLLGTTTFALAWSITHTTLFFSLFILASTILFGSVRWSKFAHMFFKPAAAVQKHLAKADGSRDNLPAPADKPAQFGLGIKRELPQHY